MNSRMLNRQNSLQRDFCSSAIRDFVECFREQDVVRTRPYRIESTVDDERLRALERFFSTQITGVTELVLRDFETWSWITSLASA